MRIWALVQGETPKQVTDLWDTASQMPSVLVPSQEPRPPTSDRSQNITMVTIYQTLTMCQVYDAKLS